MLFGVQEIPAVKGWHSRTGWSIAPQHKEFPREDTVESPSPEGMD